jgi:hypothetical protein
MSAQRSTNVQLLSWCLVAILPIAAELFLGLRHLKVSWDDAAITAAFARTWAHSGRIALTPGSQIVEGYSSILWFLLLSVPYFFTHDPDAGLIWMKVLSAGFLVLSLPVMYWIALRQFANRSAAVVSMLLLAYCYAPHQEIENGMEMNLAVFLFLLLFHVLTREQARGRVVYASLLGFLLLLTRFEMPFMLVLLFCGLLYGAYRGQWGAASAVELWKIFVVIAVLFCAIGVWRHHVFGEWMPNTVYAKRFLPYRDWSTVESFVKTRLEALNEPLFVLRLPLAVMIGALIFAMYRGEFSWAVLRRVDPAVWVLAIGCFLFGAMFGQNWGYAGRMVSVMLPFLILTMVSLCMSALPNRRLMMTGFAALLVAQGALLIWRGTHPFRNVSLETVGKIGPGADAIRAVLGQDRIVVMLPDVGMSSLCCDRLVIVDAGMLADTTLAHTGWAGFAEYFRKVRPEVVETHEFWATDANLYGGLLNGYSIVASNGLRFFVRDDLYERLVAKSAGSVVPVTSAPVCLGLKSEDAAFSLTKGTCLVLNDLRRL